MCLLQGLEHVAFSLMGGCTSVSLVSDGTEAILISKKFFLNHLTDAVQKQLRLTVRSQQSWLVYINIGGMAPSVCSITVNPQTVGVEVGRGVPLIVKVFPFSCLN